MNQLSPRQQQMADALTRLALAGLGLDETPKPDPWKPEPVRIADPYVDARMGPIISGDIQKGPVTIVDDRMGHVEPLRTCAPAKRTSRKPSSMPEPLIPRDQLSTIGAFFGMPVDEYREMERAEGHTWWQVEATLIWWTSWDEYSIDFGGPRQVRWFLEPIPDIFQETYGCDPAPKVKLRGAA